MLFPELLCRVRKEQTFQTPARLIALDPGETTGYALFRNGELADVKQLATKTIPEGVKVLHEILREVKPDFLVYENYKVYGWKADDHAWSGLHTPQFIGTIQTLCQLLGIPTHTQMAQQPKQFCTDAKLKEWGYYTRGQKHARDAIRHGTYYLLFNHK